MCAILQIGAEIGRVTGRGLAGNLRRHYPSRLLDGVVAPLIIANTSLLLPIWARWRRR